MGGTSSFDATSDEGAAAGGSSGGASGSSGAGGAAGSGAAPDAALGGFGGGSLDGCALTQPEVCNGIDDDCNGLIDDGVDFKSPSSCGTCSKNCFLLPSVKDVGCTPPAVVDGKTPGICNYNCESGAYDIVKDDSKWNSAGCEYHCVWNPGGTNTVDLGGPFNCGKDDDCDGKVDEDVDLCGTSDCGKCGKSCANLAHATGICAKAADAGASCTLANTWCAVLSCDAGWQDENKLPSDGCEKAVPDAG
jgi:hypothetical protein